MGASKHELRRKASSRAGRRAGGPWPDERQRLLLDVALAEADAAAGALVRWLDAVDPSGLDSASRRLLPLAYWNLERHGITGPGLEVFRRAFAESWVRSRQILEALDVVLDAFRAARIPVILFKGAALALATYPKSGLRPMVDLDVLVPFDASEGAGRILEGLGARSNSKDPAGRRALLHGTEHLLEAAGATVAVDLHRSVLWECRRAGDDDAFREGSLPVPGLADARMLCPADELLVVCVHGLRWSQVPPIYWVADALMLIRDKRRLVDWSRVVREARRRRLALPVGAALGFLVEEFGAPVPGTVLAELRTSSRSLRDRLELACRSRSPQPLRGLFLHWCDHARVSGVRSAFARFLTFPAYLGAMWAVGSPSKVAALALRKAVRGVGTPPDSRFSSGAGADEGSDGESRRRGGRGDRRAGPARGRPTS